MTASSPCSQTKPFADIQGIITSGYGHLPFAAYLFVTITNADGARRWLARRLVHSHHRVARPDHGRRHAEARPSVAVNVGLTAEGLRAFGLPQEVHADVSTSSFRTASLHRTGREFSATPAQARRSAWEFGGPAREPVHAMLIVFAPDEMALESRVPRAARRCSQPQGGAAELARQHATRLRPDTAFGAVRVPRRHRATVNRRSHRAWCPDRRVHPRIRESLRADPADPVVPRELNPAGMLPALDSPYHAGKDLGDLGRHGSYLVYRKLQQDVAGFWQFMAREAAAAGHPGFCAGGLARIEVRRTLAVRRTVDAGSRCAIDPRLARSLTTSSTRRSRRARVSDWRAHPAHQPARRAQAVSAAAVTEHDRGPSSAPAGRVFGTPLFEPGLLQDTGRRVSRRWRISQTTDSRAACISFA